MTDLKGAFPIEGYLSGEGGVLKKNMHTISRLNFHHSLHVHD